MMADLKVSPDADASFIDTAPALSDRFPHPARYIASRVRKHVGDAAFHLGLCEGSHMLCLASNDPALLKETCDWAQTLLARISRPPDVRVRLSLTHVGLLSRSSLLVLLGQYGKVVHLAMHGHRSLSEFGNSATATLWLPASSSVPARIEFDLRGAKLTFHCVQHSDQVGRTGHDKKADSNKNSSKNFVSAAAARKTAAAQLVRPTSDPARQVETKAASHSQSSDPASTCASAAVTSSPSAPSPGAALSSASCSFSSPSSSSSSSSSPSSSSSSLSSSSISLSSSSSDTVPACPDSVAPASPSGDPARPAAALDGVEPFSAAASIPVDDFQQVQRKKRLRSPLTSANQEAAAHSPTCSPPSQSSRHNNFRGLDEEDDVSDDEPEDFEGVVGGQEVPLSPSSASPVAASPLRKRRNSSSSPTMTAPRPSTPGRKPHGTCSARVRKSDQPASPVISSPPRREDWERVRQ